MFNILHSKTRVVHDVVYCESWQSHFGDTLEDSSFQNAGKYRASIPQEVMIHKPVQL